MMLSSLTELGWGFCLILVIFDVTLMHGPLRGMLKQRCVKT